MNMSSDKVMMRRALFSRYRACTIALSIYFTNDSQIGEQKKNKVRPKETITGFPLLKGVVILLANVNKQIGINRWKKTLCLLASLLINFSNSLDPDQDRQNVGPGLDSSRLKF